MNYSSSYSGEVTVSPGYGKTTPTIERASTAYEDAIADLNKAISGLDMELEMLSTKLQPFVDNSESEANSDAKSPGASCEALQSLYHLQWRVLNLEKHVSRLRSRLVI